MEQAKVPVNDLPSLEMTAKTEKAEKKNGYLRSLQLSKEYGLYRQDYCGCLYSKPEKA